MRIAKTAFYLLAGLFFGGCIDPIQFDVADGQQLLVVDGLVSDSLQVYTISVSQSSLVGAKATTEPGVTGATVRVLDDAGGSHAFTEATGGKYTRLMQGEVGRAYHVEVKLPDGRTVLSRPAVLSKSPPMLAPSFEVIEDLSISPSGQSLYNNLLQLNVNADASGLAARPYLRWRVSGEFEFGEDYPGIFTRHICFVKNNLDFNIVKVFDTHELEGGLLTNEPFITMSYDFRFFFNYCFHMLQYAISEEEYRYWESVRDIVSIDGSIFDPPPGTVKGNLYNPDDPADQILGYFSVAGASSGRYFINSSDLRVSVTPLCSAWPPPYNYPECYDCSKLFTSTMERPSYWRP